MAVMAVGFARRIRPLFQAVQEAWADLNAVVQENLAGARVVRAFAQEEMQRTRFEPVNRAVTDRNVEVMRLFAMRMPLFAAVLGLGQVVVLWYGGWKVIEGQATIGTLVAFNAYLLLLMMPVRMLGMTINSFARAVASGTRIFEVLDEHSEVQEAADAVVLDHARGELRFEGVAFEYEGQRVLEDLTFHVRPGEALGIVGGTGSGKSTIINLLPRFYDPSSGRVLVDDLDVRKVRMASLRAQIGIVHQEPFVFATSIRENIAYGTARRDRRAGRGRGPRRADSRLHRGPAAGLCDAGGRARRDPLGRPEATDCDCAGAASRPADSGAGRVDVER